MNNFIFSSYPKKLVFTPRHILIHMFILSQQISHILHIAYKKQEMLSRYPAEQTDSQRTHHVTWKPCLTWYTVDIMLHKKHINVWQYVNNVKSGRRHSLNHILVIDEDLVGEHDEHQSQPYQSRDCREDCCIHLQ